jgi:hypothetical protein
MIEINRNATMLVAQGGAALRACGAVRAAAVQGGTIEKKLTRPRYAAASRCSRMSGDSGSEPSQAARVSAYAGGVQYGATGWKRSRAAGRARWRSWLAWRTYAAGRWSSWARSCCAP